MDGPSYEIPPVDKPSGKRLDSWKEIAGYLNRDVTTVQRWEKREGMPVHRHLHDKRGSVYALPEELDKWIRSRKAPGIEPEAPAIEEEIAVELDDHRPAVSSRTRLWVILAIVFCIGLAAVIWLTVRHRQSAVAATSIESLAVLPLRNLSGDPSQEYLADGLTEAIIGRLAGIQKLRVISHTSVMRFKNPQISVPEIARSLSVDAIVEGSVIKEGDQIRVTAQLIRGSTEAHFWSETYDRTMEDVLSLESELAQNIAEKVKVTVSGEEQQRLSSARAVAPEVYESYLKGRFAFRQGNRAQMEQSIRYYQDSIDKDASFAPAYLGLAETYTMLGTVSAGVPASETRPKVAEYARKASSIDPGLVEAHVVLANVLQEEWHWTEAETEYQRALALNPNSAEAYHWFAMWLVCQGRTDEALRTIERARALDPVSISGSDVAWILFQAHHYDEAIREEKSALAIQPDNVLTLTGLGFALIADNRAADAVPVLEKAVSRSGSPAATGILIRAYAQTGRHSEAIRLLSELKQRRQAGYVPAGAFVNAYLGLGDNEQAFYWLEQAYREKSNILQFLISHPYFDPIRKDPRFADLVHRVGLS